MLHVRIFSHATSKKKAGSGLGPRLARGHIMCGVARQHSSFGKGSSIHLFTLQGWYNLGHTDIRCGRLDSAEISSPVASIHWHWSHRHRVRRICLIRVLHCLEGTQAWKEVEGTSAEAAADSLTGILWLPRFQSSTIIRWWLGQGYMEELAKDNCYTFGLMKHRSQNCTSAFPANFFFFFLDYLLKFWQDHSKELW